MKKLYTLIALALFSLTAVAQNSTSYFMEGSVARNQWNPAFAPNRGYVNIPFIGGIQAGISGNVALNDILYLNNGDLTTLLSPSVPASLALSNLDDMNRLGTGVNLNLIGFGAYTKNQESFWSFGLNVVANAEVRAPYELFDFAKNGTSGNFANLGLSADSYIEAAFSYSFPVIDKLYLGVRGKFLVGAARASLNFDEFSANMGAERWYAHAVGTMEISGVTPDTRYTDNNSKVYDMESLGSQFKAPAGYGFGVDIGATYDLLPELQLSLSVNDLGLMSWSKKSTAIGRLDKDIEFTGIEVDANGNASQPSSFDLDDLGFEVAVSKSINKSLRTSINAGAEYNLLDRRIGFGLFYSARFQPFKTRHNVTGSVNFRPLKWLHASGSYSVLGKDGGALGLALNICPGFINFFVATDMLMAKKNPQWVPIKQSNANVTFGLGVPIGPKGARHGLQADSKR